MNNFQSASIQRHKQIIVTILYLTLLLFGWAFPLEIEHFLYFLVVLIASLVSASKHRATKYTFALTSITLFAFTLVFKNVIYYDLILVLICIIILVHNVVSVVNFLTRSEDISHKEILGLINCYIIIGFIWAFIYMTIEILMPGSFTFTKSHEKYIDIFIYFSFSTLTTVGYGDVVAKTDLGQRVCIVEAMAGQFYFAIIVAFILNKYSHVRQNMPTRTK